MSERKAKAIGVEVRDYWQAVSEIAAVRWHEERFPTGAAMATGPTAVIVYGEITWQVLQDLELSKMTTMRPGFPEFDGPEPPNERDVARRWSSRAMVSKREEVRRMVEDEEFRKDYRPTFAPRQEDESATDFYARVAEFYRMRTALTGTPTSDLVAAAGVPKTTAAKWVREARTRGFLPATKRGRSAS